jgi:uncharacterized protein DUF4038/uncharacterized protein DUF5060
MRAVSLFCLLILPSCGILLAGGIEQYALAEFDVEATGTYGNPYTDLEATASITRPDGGVWRMPLYWDGGDMWKLRLSPDSPGRWSYRIRSADPGLNGQSGAFDCVPSRRRGSIVPMAGSPRHFQYQNGERMWFMGDTAWAYVTNSERDNHFGEQARRYAAIRASQGFNVIHTMMLSEHGVGNDGGLPFTDLADGKINPAYWQEVDRRIAHANSNGLVVGLVIAWGDKQKKEPFAWRMFPGPEARLRYARFMAARYSAYAVYFLVSGEWHAEIRTRPASSKSVFEEFVAIGDELDAADPHGRMIGIHPMTAAGTVREYNSASWMSFGDYQQNYRDLHRRIAVSTYLDGPVVNSEYGYYLRDASGNGKPDKSNSLSVDDMRDSSWDITTAGGYLVTGFGTTYFGGHRDPGPFDVDAAKNDDWEEQIGYIKSFFEQIDYWRLMPADSLLECATPRSNDRREKVDRGDRTITVIRPPVTTYWAMTIPGETYVIYGRGLVTPIRLTLDSRAGAFRARHYNPRTGQFTSQGIVDPSGSEDFYTYAPPTEADWLILLERAE